MKENSGVAASVGSFFNGVIGHGILGTVDGIATAVMNPYGTIEGINNIVGDPGTAFSALKKEVGRVWDEEVINGSWEDRSRVAGAVTFEVVTTVGGAVKAGKAAKAAKAGDKAADLGTAAKAAGVMDDATGVAAKAAGVMDDVTGVAAKAAGAMDDAVGVAAKTADIMGDAAVTAQTAKRAGKLGSVIDRALTSNLAKKAANKADDFVREIRKLLNPPELKPALASGALDDAGEVGFFTKHYNNRVEKNTPLLSNSGVNIQKAEIVGDAVDGAGDLGGIVKKGGSGAWNNSSFRKNADPFREVMGPGVDSHPEQWNALLKEMKDNGVEIVYREGAMAYSPAKGVAGQLVVDSNSSYSALLHEYTHYLDDVAAGFPGMEYHFQTINRVKMELHAYMQEIKLADLLGYKDVANQLFENYRAERELLAGHLK